MDRELRDREKGRDPDSGRGLRGREIAPFLALAALVLAASPAYMPTLPPVGPDPCITLVAVGDVLLARGIGERIDRHGLEWPFQHVTSILESADIAFCNLECPLTERGAKVNKVFCFKADPGAVQCLSGAGFDIVSLANNHTLDCGRTGLVETMDVLDAAKIAYTGAGRDEAGAREPVILGRNGLRIAFLARNALLPESPRYRTNAPSIALLDPDTIEDEVADAARQADVVIVSLHWGVEYREYPQPDQEELAHRIIDAGADLVLGHHPHATQPVEEYHGGLIAYSLGNFLFDNASPWCRESMILKVWLTRSGPPEYEVIPVELADWRPTPNCHPLGPPFVRGGSSAGILPAWECTPYSSHRQVDALQNWATSGSCSSASPDSDPGASP
jgi:poly-gamma-glutamate capsule biosynthesis protein CapA/YwtB (metallophosphatase superfamily)